MGEAKYPRKSLLEDESRRKRVQWVECDENNVPLKKSFVKSRGDVPEDGEVLPWGDLPVSSKLKFLLLLDSSPTQVQKSEFSNT